MVLRTLVLLLGASLVAGAPSEARMRCRRLCRAQVAECRATECNSLTGAAKRRCTKQCRTSILDSCRRDPAPTVCGAEKIVLDAPQGDAPYDFTAPLRFAWTVRYRESGAHYCYWVLTSGHGGHPFVGVLEETFLANESESIEVTLDAFRYWELPRNAFTWGVNAVACDDPAASCEEAAATCAGRTIRSEIGYGRLAEEAVRLVAPPDGATADLAPTLLWQVDNQRPGVRYCSNLYVDKGWQPFDGGYEFRRLLEDTGQLQLTLSDYYFSPSSFDWGIAMTACSDPTATCADSETPCEGVTLYSDIRRLRIP